MGIYMFMMQMQMNVP